MPTKSSPRAALRTRRKVTPAEAAALLSMSRPQVRKLIDRGLLEFHRHIRVSSIRAFLDAERLRRRGALADLSTLQNEPELSASVGWFVKVVWRVGASTSAPANRLSLSAPWI
ncbi:helix-turn-helix domain-containing protein [Symbioplanes lichenis]|uniref:helix-turn-helix domain-containing protein n=1 Tax=Symbioplanes lichenis TaxID=1629072 RepID=UPI0034DAF21A